MKKKIFLVTTLSLIFVILYFLIASNFNQKKFTVFTKFLNEEQKVLIKKYIFPYDYIEKLEEKPSGVLSHDIERKEKLESILFENCIYIKRLYWHASWRLVLESFRHISSCQNSWFNL